MIVTDKLASYQVAAREVLPSVTHRRAKHPQQPGRELPSADQGPGTGDENASPYRGRPNGSCLRSAPLRQPFRAPSSSDHRAPMANRDDQPFRGLEPDHYRRSGLKDAVSHYLSPPNPLTSTAPQPFPNNLTMPPRRAGHRQAGQLPGRPPRAHVVGGAPAVAVSEQPRRDPSSAHPKRERAMKRFKSSRHAQRFLSAFSGISAHFRPRRHLLSATEWRTEMADRFAVWCQDTAPDAAA